MITIDDVRTAIEDAVALLLQIEKTLCEGAGAAGLAALLALPNGSAGGEDTRARLVERAGLIAGRGYAASRVAAEFKAAAAGKTEIKAVEVRNRHDRAIGVIQPDHRGGFTIKVKPMTELHPSFRLEYARLVNERFVELIKTWFDRDA